MARLDKVSDSTAFIYHFVLNNGCNNKQCCRIIVIKQRDINKSKGDYYGNLHNIWPFNIRKRHT